MREGLFEVLPEFGGGLYRRELWKRVPGLRDVLFECVVPVSAQELDVAKGLG